MGKHDATKTPAPKVCFTSGDNEPQRYHDKLYFHRLDEGGNLPLKNKQAADRYEYLAQSVVPFFGQCERECSGRRGQITFM